MPISTTLYPLRNFPYSHKTLDPFAPTSAKTLPALPKSDNLSYALKPSYILSVALTN